MQLRGSALAPGDVPHAVTHFARYSTSSGQSSQEGGEEYFLHLVRDKHASYGVLNMTYCALKLFTPSPWNAVGVEKIPRREAAGEDARHPREGEVRRLLAATNNLKHKANARD